MASGLGQHHREEEAAYNSFYEGDGKVWDGSNLHEGVAGAAAFYAMKKLQERDGAQGHNDHSYARDMLSSVAASEVDKLAERTGMDPEQIDCAKESARERASRMYETSYLEKNAPEPPGGTAAARAPTANAGNDSSAADYANQGPEGGSSQQRAQGFGAEQGFGGRGSEAGFRDAGASVPQHRVGFYSDGVESKAGYDQVGYAYSFGGDQMNDPSLNDYSGDGIVVPPSTLDARYASYPGQRERHGRGGLGDI